MYACIYFRATAKNWPILRGNNVYIVGGVAPPPPAPPSCRQMTRHVTWGPRMLFLTCTVYYCVGTECYYKSQAQLFQRWKELGFGEWYVKRAVQAAEASVSLIIVHPSPMTHCEEKQYLVNTNSPYIQLFKITMFKYGAAPRTNRSDHFIFSIPSLWMETLHPLLTYFVFLKHVTRGEITL